MNPLIVGDFVLLSNFQMLESKTCKLARKKNIRKGDTSCLIAEFVSNLVTSGEFYAFVCLKNRFLIRFASYGHCVGLHC